MWAWHFEVLSLMVDFTHQGGISVDAVLGVELNGVGAPGGRPELIHDVHVFLAYGIAFVVLGLLLAVGEVASCAVEVAGHDVPSNSGSCQRNDQA